VVLPSPDLPPRAGGGGLNPTATDYATLPASRATAAVSSAGSIGFGK